MISLRQVRRRPLNPVLARELKERMRRRRSGVVLTAYLLLLGGAMWLLYLGASSGTDGPSVLRLASLGRAAFQTLLFAMLILVCFIVPGLAAGGIAGERERQTLLPMQVTLLRPRSILLGKLGASLAFVTYLVVAALPFMGVTFLLGGVEPGEVVRGVAMVLVVAAMLASLALTCSTLMRRVQGATVMSYALVALLMGGPFVAFGAQLLVDREGPEGRSQLVMALNPLVATADVVSRAPNSGSRFPSPFTPLQEMLDEREERPDGGFGDGFGVGIPPQPAIARAEAVGKVQAGGFGEVQVGEVQVGEVEVGQAQVPGVGNAAVGGAAAPGDQWRAPFLNRVPMWVMSLIAFSLLSVAGLALSTRRLGAPAAGER